MQFYSKLCTPLADLHMQLVLFYKNNQKSIVKTTNQYFFYFSDNVFISLIGNKTGILLFLTQN